jgi:hypothetical protein
MVEDHDNVEYMEQSKNTPRGTWLGRSTQREERRKVKDVGVVS